MKHSHIIGIVPVAVAVPLIPVLAVIVIVRPIISPPLSFFVLGDGFFDMPTFLTIGYREAVQAVKVVFGKSSTHGQSTRS